MKGSLLLIIDHSSLRVSFILSILSIPVNGSAFFLRVNR